MRTCRGRRRPGAALQCRGRADSQPVIPGRPPKGRPDGKLRLTGEGGRTLNPEIASGSASGLRILPTLYQGDAFQSNVGYRSKPVVLLLLPPQVSVANNPKRPSAANTFLQDHRSSFFDIMEFPWIFLAFLASYDSGHPGKELRRWASKWCSRLLLRFLPYLPV